MQAAVTDFQLSRPRSTGLAMWMLAAPFALAGAFGIIATVSSEPGAPSRMAEESAGASNWRQPVVVGGKITDRHRGAAGDDEGYAPSIVRPAALVMPMSADWPEYHYAEAGVVDATAEARIATAAQAAPAIKRPAPAV